MKTFWLVPSAVLMLILSGCALRPYQNPIEQGILLSPSQISQVQVGMTQDQVSYILGTPNLVDPYHANTWYYIYTNEQDYKPLVQHNLLINFDATGKVISIQEQ